MSDDEFDYVNAPEWQTVATAPAANGMSVPSASVPPPLPIDATPAPLTQPANGALPMPPGFVGQLAQFIYQQAPRPVAEVAIVGALGLMAGVCGKVWHIPDSGLNLYVVLVARSAIGKEAMHSGIAKIVQAALPSCPIAGNFVDFTEYASGPALIKACAHNQCFVNVSGEIGHRFRAMADNRDPAMRTLRTQMTNLYTKSAPNSVSGGISYSDQERNVEALKGVAFSVLGETTPGTFYESLTPAMMEDGFMSRFCVIEYGGDRPAKNPNPVQRPSQAVIDHIVRIMMQSDMAMARGDVQEVSFSEGAQALLDRFEDECDAAIHAAGDDESRRQLWNRAVLKALRVAALLAVGDAHLAPVVTEEQAAWAVMLVRHGIAAFLKRIDAGEVGEGTDGGREAKLLEICREFLRPGGKMPSDLKNGEQMRENAIIPRNYLQTRTQRVAAFDKYKFGAKAALELAINTALANGWIMEIKKDKLVEMYSFHGKAYRVLNLPK